MNRKFYQKKRIIIPLSIGFCLVLLSIFGALHSSFYHSTTNAKVMNCNIKIFPQISSKIIEINVENNAIIKKGEIIAKLDGQAYKNKMVELEQNFTKAQKELNSFENEINEMNVKTAKTKKDIELAKINLENANEDYVRYKNEYKDGTVTKKDLDNAIKNLETAQVQYENAQKNLKETNSILKEIAIKKDEQMEKLKETLEKLEDTRLQLSFTTIIAPRSGKIANFNAKINDEVDNKKALLEIIPDEIDIVANFKKLPNTNFKIGQKAKIKLYCDGLKKLDGEISEILPEAKNYISVKIKVVNQDTCKINSGAKAFIKVKKEL